MAILRALAVLRNNSGLARDNAVNTFHFDGEPTIGDTAAIVSMVRDFYLDPLPGAAGDEPPVANGLSPAIDTIDVLVYEMPGTLTGGRETPSGPPIASSLGSPNAVSSIVGAANALPAEVAICVSFEGSDVGGDVQKRRKGRIYIGPLNDGISSQVGDVARPAAAYRNNTLGPAIRRLNADADAAGIQFCVYSRPYPGRAEIERPGRATLPAIPARPLGTLVPVETEWVDDEFDTMRKRGLRYTSRTKVDIDTP